MQQPLHANALSSGLILMKIETPFTKDTEPDYVSLQLSSSVYSSNASEGEGWNNYIYIYIPNFSNQ